MNKAALRGYRVVEAGQLIAGPFTGTILGYFGASIIKIEDISGDPIRKWRTIDVDDDKTSPWWHSIARNKRSIALDLSDEEVRRRIVRRLLSDADVFVENFKPGTMEKWGLSPTHVAEINPALVYTRVSGYGQDGPKAGLAGYASVCEAAGGLRYVTGNVNGETIRSNLSIGDTLASLHAALGTLMALLARDGGRHRHPVQSGVGQVVDASIAESVFNMLESMVPEYDRFGIIRQASGSTVTGIVPTNAFLCKDGKYVIIGGNGDSIYARLMKTAKREDMLKYSTNQLRVENQKEVEAAITGWTTTLMANEVVTILQKNGVPCGPINDIKMVMEDEHFRARGLFEKVQNFSNQSITVPAIAPKLSATGGGNYRPAPRLGEHTRQILTEIGVSNEEIESMAKRGVIKMYESADPKSSNTSQS